ncbi:MAG: hypothetical protein AAF843_02680 [Bacteroidota bacterium]
MPFGIRTITHKVVEPLKIETLRFRNTEFENWAEYFRWMFSDNSGFRTPKEERRNQAIIESYRNKNPRDETEIVVTYIDDCYKLIHYEIINPLTLGFTAFQKKSCQYFEQGHFAETPEYGEPGLDFNLVNITGIDKELTEGLNGQEVQFLKGGKVVKAIVSLQEYSMKYTYRFDNKGLLIRLGRKLFRKDDELGLTKRTIDLRDIFQGIKKTT